MEYYPIVTPNVTEPAPAVQPQAPEGADVDPSTYSNWFQDGLKSLLVGYANILQQHELAELEKKLNEEYEKAGMPANPNDFDLKAKAQKLAKKIKNDSKKDEENKKAAEERERKARENDVISIKSENNKKSFEKFGNNFFILSDGNGNACKGVLLELPAFSMSTKWSESPIASMAETLLKYINKPEFEFLATKDNQNYKVIRRSGNLTSKVYESTEPVSFELTFRCYSGQEFGDDTNLSSADKWKSFLDKATINELKSNELLDTVTGNMGAVAAASVNQSLDLIGDIKNALKGLATKEDNSGFWDVKDFEKIGSHTGGLVTTVKYKNKVTGEILPVSSTQPYGLEGVVKEHNDKIIKNTNERTKLADEQLENIEKNINKNEERVINSSEKYGAQLYKLTIYPFVFKAPLIIYVSTWSIKPSKEWNEKLKSYYYYDFALSCSMDQIPSSSTWNNSILM